MGHVVSFRSAVVLLGRFPALSGLDLTVDRGEVLLLRGPNGAGKTTVLKACAGLLAVHGGEVEVLGHDLRLDRRRVRKVVGLVGHDDGLYDELTVMDNARFWARASRIPVGEMTAALERVALEPRLADVAVGRLSAGQRRRAALGVLVARRPSLWLLDEPHGGLDSDGRDLLDGLISEAAGAGATVMFASHEHDRADRVSTRVVDIVGGQALTPVAATADPSGAHIAP